MRPAIERKTASAAKTSFTPFHSDQKIVPICTRSNQRNQGCRDTTAGSRQIFRLPYRRRWLLTPCPNSSRQERPQKAWQRPAPVSRNGRRLHKQRVDRETPLASHAARKFQCGRNPNVTLAATSSAKQRDKTNAHKQHAAQDFDASEPSPKPRAQLRREIGKADAIYERGHGDRAETESEPKR